MIYLRKTSILSVIHIVTIGTMLNVLNVNNKGYGLKKLRVHRLLPLRFSSERNFDFIFLISKDFCFHISSQQELVISYFSAVKTFASIFLVSKDFYFHVSVSKDP